MILRWLLAVASLASCAVVLAYSAHPGRPIQDLVLYYLLALSVVLVTQVVTAVLSLFKTPLRAHRTFFVGLFLASVVTVLLALTLVPLRVSVLLSHRWLRREARLLLYRSNPGSAAGWEAHRVGLFRIESARVRNGVAYLDTGECGWFCSAGFAYAPRGLPRPAGRTLEDPRYDHLYGDWWRFRTQVD
jgi:hypothetical protein